MDANAVFATMGAITILGIVVFTVLYLQHRKSEEELEIAQANYDAALVAVAARDEVVAAATKQVQPEATITTASVARETAEATERLSKAVNKADDALRALDELATNFVRANPLSVSDLAPRMPLLHPDIKPSNEGNLFRRAYQDHGEAFDLYTEGQKMAAYRGLLTAIYSPASTFEPVLFKPFGPVNTEFATRWSSPTTGGFRFIIHKLGGLEPLRVAQGLRPEPRSEPEVAASEKARLKTKAKGGGDGGGYIGRGRGPLHYK